MKLRIATRKSLLARTQADGVAARLREAGHEAEKVLITTTGDRFQKETPAEAAAKIEGGKGLFVKEIEEALLDGRADLAVHSAKDLPGELAAGLAIGAYPEREDASDVLVAGMPLAELPEGAVVGSSSPRRRIQLKMLRPDLKIEGLRGNVDTRLRKQREGLYAGVVLAAAGMNRLGREEGREPLDIVSAPGQGALAIEAKADRKDVREILAGLDDAGCRVEVEAERRIQRAVGGGCLTPLGARAELDGSWMRLTVFHSDEAGEHPLRLSARTKTAPDKLAFSVEQLVLRLNQLQR